MKKILLGIFVLSVVAFAKGSNDCAGEPCDIEKALIDTAVVKFEANLITPIKLTVSEDCVDFGQIINDKDCINETPKKKITLQVSGGKNRDYFLTAFDSNEGKKPQQDKAEVELKNGSEGGLWVKYTPAKADTYLPGTLGANGKDDVEIEFELFSKVKNLKDGCYSGAMVFEVNYRNYSCGDQGCGV